MNLLLLDQLTEEQLNTLRNDAVSRVGRLLRTRTKPRGGTGAPIGNFTEQTEPTYGQVQELVDDASREVFITAGQHFTDATSPAAWVLIAIHAAMLVELGYPIDQRHSQYDRLEKLYETGLKRLEQAVLEEEAGGESGAGDSGLLPVFSFDDCDTHVEGAECALPETLCWP